MVVWNHTITGTQNPAGSIQEIRGQEISPTGALVGGEINFSNNGIVGTTSQPHIAVASDGAYLVTWTQSGPTTSGADILGEFKKFNLTPTLPSTNQNDTIVGTAVADVIDAAGGDDRITGGGGNDTINGGSGFDSVQFGGKLANYTLSANDVTLVVTDRVGADGSDQLENVEQLVFADRSFDFTMAAKAAKLSPPISTDSSNSMSLTLTACRRPPDSRTGSTS